MSAYDKLDHQTLYNFAHSGSPDTLRQAAQMWQTHASALQSATDQLNQNLADIQSQWQGAAADTYFQQSQAVADKMQSHADDAASTSSAMTSAASALTWARGAMPSPPSTAEKLLAAPQQHAGWRLVEDVLSPVAGGASYLAKRDIANSQAKAVDTMTHLAGLYSAAQEELPVIEQLKEKNPDDSGSPSPPSPVPVGLPFPIAAVPGYGPGSDPAYPGLVQYNSPNGSGADSRNADAREMPPSGSHAAENSSSSGGGDTTISGYTNSRPDGIATGGAGGGATPAGQGNSAGGTEAGGDPVLGAYNATGARPGGQRTGTYQGRPEDEDDFGTPGRPGAGSGDYVRGVVSVPRGGRYAAADVEGETGAGIAGVGEGSEATSSPGGQPGIEADGSAAVSAEPDKQASSMQGTMGQGMYTHRANDNEERGQRASYLQQDPDYWYGSGTQAAPAGGVIE